MDSWNPCSSWIMGLLGLMNKNMSWASEIIWSQRLKFHQPLCLVSASLSLTPFSQQHIFQSSSPYDLKHGCRELLYFICLTNSGTKERLLQLFFSLWSKNQREVLIGSAWGFSLKSISCGQEPRSHDNLAAWRQGARSRSSN